MYTIRYTMTNAIERVITTDSEDELFAICELCEKYGYDYYIIEERG